MKGKQLQQLPVCRVDLSNKNYNTHNSPRKTPSEKMAASRHLTDPGTNIPDYEYQDVNTKPFHIDSFRTEWLNILKPNDYSFQVEDEDTFDAKFAQELGVNTETMTELKSVCK